MSEEHKDASITGRALAARWGLTLLLIIVSGAVGQSYAGLFPAVISLVSLVVLVWAIVGTVRFVRQRMKDRRAGQGEQ